MKSYKVKCKYQAKDRDGENTLICTRDGSCRIIGCYKKCPHYRPTLFTKIKRRLY